MRSYSYRPDTTRTHSWEAPVVGKYYFRPASRRTPYIGLGVAMRRSWQTFLHLAPAFSCGMALSPEFRYTRWSAETQVIPRNPNQVEFLFGISF
ncbi:MAG: hypothetical protein ACKV2U_18160 [Bryobacteraceae bacterium]